MESVFTTDHPTRNIPAEPGFTTVHPGCRVTTIDSAIPATTDIVGASMHATSLSTYTLLEDDGSAPVDGSLASDDVTAQEDGASQPLLSELAPVDSDDATAREDGASQPILSEFAPVNADAEATAPHPITALFQAHDLAMSTAIADVITTANADITLPSHHDDEPSHPDDDDSPASLKATLESILCYIKNNDHTVTDLSQTTTAQLTCLAWMNG